MRSQCWSSFVGITVTVCAAATGYIVGRAAPVRAAEGAEVLLEADRAFDRETNARRIAGWVDWFAEDGRMFPDGRDVIQGKAAIRELMEPLFSHPENSLRWEPIGGDMAASGELGYTYGRSTLHRPNAAGETGDYFGKYVTIWKKQADGGWKVEISATAGPGRRPRGAFREVCVGF
jgi:ketosteroid isomerase-like protein